MSCLRVSTFQRLQTPFLPTHFSAFERKPGEMEEEIVCNRWRDLAGELISVFRSPVWPGLWNQQ